MQTLTDRLHTLGSSCRLHHIAETGSTAKTNAPCISAIPSSSASLANVIGSAREGLAAGRRDEQLVHPGECHRAEIEQALGLGVVLVDRLPDDVSWVERAQIEVAPQFVLQVGFGVIDHPPRDLDELCRLTRHLWKPVRPEKEEANDQHDSDLRQAHS